MVTEQTKIKEFPVCPHFSYCKNLMLNPAFGGCSSITYRDMADVKGLPCYENDQTSCEKFNRLEITGERIQVRLPPGYRAVLERRKQNRLKKQKRPNIIPTIGTDVPYRN